jgi:hypothetical protein
MRCSTRSGIGGVALCVVTLFLSISLIFSATTPGVLAQDSAEADTLGRSFTTIVALPDKVVLTFPQHNATGVSLNPVLQWQTATLADAYQLQVATDEAYTQLFTDTIISETGFALSGLQNGVTYYWRVRGLNPAGAGEWSGK